MLFELDSAEITEWQAYFELKVERAEHNQATAKARSEAAAEAKAQAHGR
jgi:hypothetical protein